MDYRQRSRLYSSPKDVRRVVLNAPKVFCIYDQETVVETLNFINQIPYVVFQSNSYLKLDFSDTEEITAAAVLILFAHVTRCQACSSKSIFQFHDQVIEVVAPKNRKCRSAFVESGLWAAIRPGGIRKIDGSWADPEQPFKTGKSPETQRATT